MRHTMRICLVSLLFTPSIGGTQARAEKQARRLQELGQEVIVVTLRCDRQWKRKENLDGLPVVRVGGIYRRKGQLRMGRVGYIPIAISMLLMLWRLRSQYDLIHVFDVSPLAAVAVFIGKITRKPIVISVQNTGPSQAQRERLGHGAMLMADTLTNTSYLKVNFKDWIIQTGDFNSLLHIAVGGKSILGFLKKSFAIYQVLSTRSHSYLISQGFRAENIVHISGSVDTEKFRPLPERELLLKKAERQIICVARLEYSKGIDVLLHAWGRMMHAPAEWRAHLKPRLCLVGEGHLMTQMEYIVAELGIQDSVEFLGARRDIVHLLQQSWGFVLPSRWEGMPNALLEAMACGLPCIATRVSGSEDIIADGINGLLVEPEHPSEMAEVLRRVVEDVNLAQRLGQEGRATVARDFQLSNIVEQLLEVYRCLLTRVQRDTSTKNYKSAVFEGRRSNE